MAQEIAIKPLGGLQGAGDGGWALPNMVDCKDKELIYTLIVHISAESFKAAIQSPSGRHLNINKHWSPIQTKAFAGRM